MLRERLALWLRGWEVLPTSKDPQSLGEAMTRLTSKRGGDRAIAAQDLVRLYPEEAEEALGPLLSDTDWRVRSIAIKSLAKVLGRRGWLVYANGLSDPNPTAASAAWTAMRAVAGPGDIAELLAFSETANPKIRSAIRSRAAYLDSPGNQG
jgi:HEAT repeat protein